MGSHHIVMSESTFYLRFFRFSAFLLLVFGIYGGIYGGICGSEALAGTGVSLFPRTTGYFHTNYKYMVDGGRDEVVKIPIPFYVIRHPRGIVLFDSGLGREFKEQVQGWWIHRLVNKILPEEFSPSESAASQLQKMGISPEDVRYIIVSHFHYDHVGGLRDLPEATILASRREWAHVTSDRIKARLRGMMVEQLKGVPDRVRPVDYSPISTIPPFQKAFDVFEDGSLLILPTPGHSPGHQSLLVTLDSGKKVLLSGDAVWVRENYERPAPKGLLVRLLEEDAPVSWTTTRQIHEFHQSHPEVLIIPGHDPYLWKDLPSELR